MSEYIPPCANPANNPDDWFIGRDGKQYPDDVLLTLDEVDVEMELRKAENPDEPVSFTAVVKELEAEKAKAPLRRRRHAKDKCFVECKMRLECLSRALDLESPVPAVLIEYGTFGGYFEEERRQIVTAALERRERSSA